MYRIIVPNIAAILFVSAGMPISAQAVTAEDYANKLEGREQTAYLLGALEMALGLYKTKLKQPEKSTCIKKFFANHNDEANKELTALTTNPKNAQYPAAAMIALVIQRHCGE